MHKPGDILSYLELCQEEGESLQKGMNFRLAPKAHVFLMSRRPGAPYNDHVKDGGRTLFYEGHDTPQRTGGPSPKSIDQSLEQPNGRPTSNGLFYSAAGNYKSTGSVTYIRVYEKLKPGIWVFNGVFQLQDAYWEEAEQRKVIKFRLHIVDAPISAPDPIQGTSDLPHQRMIPSSVKQAVFKRDRGQCVECGAKDNLHFDHEYPFSKGGSSLVAENIRLLCARHNLQKRDKIQ
jgi:hypothetical protein